MIKLLFVSFIMSASCFSWGARLPTAKGAPKNLNQMSDKQPKWLLKNFINMVRDEPERVLSLGQKLFSDERLRTSSLEPSMAHEWQHRLAMATALSEFFNPDVKIKSSNFAQHRFKARKILTRALLEDPSMLVRDGAVESLRRVFRMQPGEARLWKKSLESAFLSQKNFMDGEGFFIRETLLTAMKEGGLTLSKPVKLAAARDKNQGVRNLLNQKVPSTNAWE